DGYGVGTHEDKSGLPRLLRFCPLDDLDGVRPPNQIRGKLMRIRGTAVEALLAAIRGVGLVDPVVLFEFVHLSPFVWYRADSSASKPASEFSRNSTAPHRSRH